MPTPLSLPKSLGIHPILAAFVVLNACFGPASGQDADAKLEGVFRRHLDEQFAQRPLDATRLGDHRFDHRLDDVSPRARQGWDDLARKTLAALTNEVDYSRLSRAGQIDLEIFRSDLTQSLWVSENLRPFERDPRVYIERISDSVFLLLTQSTLPKETNIANGIARMREIPKVVAAAKASLQRPARPILETAIRQNRGAISFYETELFKLAGATPQLPALKAAAAEVVPVLRELQTFLEKEVLPRSDPEWRIGKEKFYRKLVLELDAGMSADQVLLDAEAEFARVENELAVMARQLWGRYVPKTPLPTDNPAGRREMIQRVLSAVNQEHGRPENLVNDARATVARIQSFIRESDFIRLPEPDRCQVIEMPEFQRGNSVAYLNSAPPLDPDAASLYAISPPPSDWDPARVRSLLEEYNQHMLQILTIHEAYPGHYVQLEYSNRTRSPIRRVLQSGVFIEGWAVYTEQTMLDQGYGDGDLRLRLMQLKFYLRAVGNAILDHKMHCADLSDDAALKFLTERAFQSEGEARLKIVRAKQSSVQLSTYFVGRMAHYRLRQQIQQEMGDKFVLGRFHEAVLANGSVPVKYLGELVRNRLAGN